MVAATHDPSVLIAAHDILAIRQPDVVFPEPGGCIYCGEDNPERPLGREHIIPDAIGGYLILPRACCRDCEIDTAAYERPTILGNCGGVRTAEAIHSNKKRGKNHVRPETYKSYSESLVLPAMEHRIHKEMPHMIIYDAFSDRPLLLGGSGVNVDGEFLHFAMNLTSAWPYDSPLQTRAISSKFLTGGYAKMIQKIAYSYACAILGRSRFQASYREALTTRDMALNNNCVGQTSLTIDARKDVLHTIELRRQLMYLSALNSYRSMVFARVNLFCSYGIEPYEVAIGIEGDFPVAKLTDAQRKARKAARTGDIKTMTANLRGHFSPDNPGVPKIVFEGRNASVNMALGQTPSTMGLVADTDALDRT